MRSKITILIFLSILSINCFSQQPNNVDWILLIDYNEYTFCEVLEIDGQKVDPKKHFCDKISATVDDFSEFFPIKRVFYYDGEVEITDNDIILFWDYDLKKQIDSLSFTYSRIKIENIKNDSILKILLNNKQMYLSPNEVKKDTIVLTKKEKNKLVKYTIFITVENLGLIKNENVIDNKDWKIKSFELRLDAPITADVMPEFKGGMLEFQKYLTDKIGNATLSNSEITDTKLFVQFIIDEKGDVTMVRILRGINQEINKQVKVAIENMPKWKPGMTDDEVVPVRMVIPINIEVK